MGGEDCGEEVDVLLCEGLAVKEHSVSCRCADVDGLAVNHDGAAILGYGWVIRTSEQVVSRDVEVISDFL